MGALTKAVVGMVGAGLITCGSLAWGTLAIGALGLGWIVANNHASADWNNDGVDWRSYDDGLARSADTDTPVFLLFYTDWCPHCHNVSWLFHEPELVALSAQYVMIRVNRDENRDISAMYAPDGEYIPRVFIVRPDGTARDEITANEDSDFLYFPDEYNSDNLASIMQRGLRP